MSETWLERGIAMIAALDAQLPADMPIAERKKLIQQEAWRFHGGTSWGRKIWPKAKRAYFKEPLPKSDAAIPPAHLSPLERLMAKSRAA